MNEGGKRFVKEAVRKRLERNGLDPAQAQEITDHLDLNASDSCRLYKNLRKSLSGMHGETLK